MQSLLQSKALHPVTVTLRELWEPHETRLGLKEGAMSGTPSAGEAAVLTGEPGEAGRDPEIAGADCYKSPGLQSQGHQSLASEHYGQAASLVRRECSW